MDTCSRLKEPGGVGWKDVNVGRLRTTTSGKQLIWSHRVAVRSDRWPAVDDELVQAVARGIRSVDANHIHTVELNYSTSGSLEDQSWALELNAAYTYFPTYAQV